jgi:hypothetical protein
LIDKVQKLRARQKGLHSKQRPLSTAELVDQQQWQEEHRQGNLPRHQEQQQQLEEKGEDKGEETHQRHQQQDTTSQPALRHQQQQLEQLHLHLDQGALPQQQQQQPLQRSWPGNGQPMHPGKHSPGAAPKFSDWQQYCNYLVNSDLLIHRQRGKQGAAPDCLCCVMSELQLTGSISVHIKSKGISMAGSTTCRLTVDFPTQIVRAFKGQWQTLLKATGGQITWRMAPVFYDYVAADK